MSMDPNIKPGALWMVYRLGSRSSNRTVVRIGPGPRRSGYWTTHGDGIFYRDNRGTQWCSLAAWRKWVRNHDARHAGTTQHEPAP